MLEVGDFEEKVSFDEGSSVNEEESSVSIKKREVKFEAKEMRKRLILSKFTLGLDSVYPIQISLG